MNNQQHLGKETRWPKVTQGVAGKHPSLAGSYRAQHFLAGFWPWKLWEMGSLELNPWQGQLKTRCCTSLQPLSWHAVFLCVLLQMFQFDDTLDVSELPHHFETSFISNHKCYPPPKWARSPWKRCCPWRLKNGCVCRSGDGKTGQSGSWGLRVG